MCYTTHIFEILVEKYMSDIVISTENLHKFYGARDQKVHALRGLNLSINEGEIVGVMGPSGCGKTTLLNCISGKFKPDSGLVKSFETVLFSSDFKIDIPPEKRSIGYVMQDSSLFPHLNVIDNITFNLKTGNQATHKTHKG